MLIQCGKAINVVKKRLDDSDDLQELKRVKVLDLQYCRVHCGIHNKRRAD